MKHFIKSLLNTLFNILLLTLALPNKYTEELKLEGIHKDKDSL